MAGQKKSTRLKKGFLIGEREKRFRRTEKEGGATGLHRQREGEEEIQVGGVWSHTHFSKKAFKGNILHRDPSRKEMEGKRTTIVVSSDRNGISGRESRHLRGEQARRTTARTLKTPRSENGRRKLKRLECGRFGTRRSQMGGHREKGEKVTKTGK